jgi:hypothetical protein
MLLVVEFVLVNVAWGKGWKWRTLISFGVGCLVMIISGFLIGLGEGLAGGAVTKEQTMSVIKPITSVVQVCLIIILTYMAMNKRKLPLINITPTLDNHSVDVPIQMGNPIPSSNEEVKEDELPEDDSSFSQGYE